MEALAWIGQIVEWIGQWIPRWMILDTTEAGIKFVRGNRPVVMLPGIHFYWPVTTKTHVYPTARQADELRSQTMMTADDKTIVAAGLIVYEVSDIALLVPRVFRSQDAIKDLALTVVHDVCCGFSWEDLKTEQRRGTLDTKLRNAAKKVLAEYGVEVIKVQLTDLAPVRVLKVMTSKEDIS